MKKWIFTSAFFVASLSAESNLEDFPTSLPSIQQTSENTPSPPSETTSPSPPSSNLCNQKESVRFTGQALFWMVTEEGLNYGVALGPALNPSVPVITPLTGSDFPGQDYTSEYVHPHMNVGTRVNCTVPFRDSWDAAVIWTNYANHRFTSITIPSGNDQVLAPIFVNLAGSPSGQGARVSWQLSLNILDMDLARLFNPNPHFLIRTHIGVRGAWVGQQLNTKYNSISFDGGSPTSVAFLLTKNKNNFQGWGLRFGIDNTWSIPYGFKLLVNVSGSLLKSTFRISQNETTNTGQKAVFLSNTQYDTQEILELALGIGWEKCWDRLKKLSIDLCWEENVWFHQSQLFYFTSLQVTTRGLPLQGNLGFSGPTLAMSFAF